ncbi:SIMPL domain-containing protein [Marisediminicola senii]|uniref:SIMPL domain-containing protein n=1 Tax=Marisediminicola senii TaxID=2711233 RepID=UPI0013EC5B2C|nr:SIMPL domain-containing protein [Marisediminicola senii]
MTHTTITVRGEHMALLAPELATVDLTIQHDGPVRDAVVAALTSTADRLIQAIVRATDRHPSPLVSSANESVRVWAERPWTPDGVQQDHVHHATMRFSVVIDDFVFLDGFVDDVAAMPGIAVEGVSWSLTEPTRLATLDDVRQRAVQDAVAKATVYARTIGIDAVRVTALADAGMLTDAGRPATGFEQSMMLRSAPAAAPGISLHPEEIEVSAAVDARFTAP